MTDQLAPRSYFRARFSLLTLMLLLTIVALAIVVAVQWREVLPLRSEVRQLRTELGYLSIDDPTKAYAIALPTSETDSWRWRVYLPPGSRYSLHNASGELPQPSSSPGEGWFQSIGRNRVGSSSSSGVLHDEFTLDARVYKQDEQWLLTTRVRNQANGAKVTSSTTTSIRQPSGDWLSDHRSRFSTSALDPAEQSSFDPSKPILLLHLQRPINTSLPNGGHSSNMPTGPADGIAIWLQQEPLTAAPATGTP